MLEIHSLRIRNFWSYGDYDTIIEFAELGSCLITGEINGGFGEDVDVKKTSNGAGKSALVEAILWCLFGRTMRIPNPGDKIINFFTKKDCIVEIILKNGDKIRRSRNVDGHNDLLYVKNGEDVSLGTSKMEQGRLDRILDLDFDIFTGSTFFSQFGKSWMEISDLKRKEALEREFKLDKVQLYADTAKSKLNNIKQEQDKINIQLNAMGDKHSNIKSQISQFIESSKKFDELKQNRIDNTKKMLEEAIEARDSVELLDVDIISKLWSDYKNSIKSITDNIDNKKSELYELEKQKRKLENDIEYNSTLIEKWNIKKGKICTSCNQEILESHVVGQIKNPSEKVDGLEKEIAKLLPKIKHINDKISALNDELNSIEKPKTTIQQANQSIRERERYEKQIDSLKSSINKINNEVNEYDKTIDKLTKSLADLDREILEVNKRLARFDKLLLHISYIHRAYHDRRKIKSYLISEYIPYLNSRVKYYLNKFGLDLSIEFTNALGIKTDTWGYQQFSGGECKRFDVAMMLAMFDLHTIMYSRSCNIIVFDEVDGRLDVNGAEIFADIIRTDFADKVDAVLVISQRVDMRNSMSSEIRITREDRFSRILEVSK